MKQESHKEMPRMPVTTELEALAVCQEQCLNVDFRKNHQKGYAYVVLRFGFFDIAGRTLIEAVNRVIEKNQTPHGEVKELPWYSDSEALMLG